MSFLRQRGTRLVYVICIHLALGTSIWGYNIGVLSSVLVHPSWDRRLSPSDKGLVTGIYYLGTLVSYLLVSHPLADWLGRRPAAMLGTLVLSLGALVMASAGGAGVLILGRWVSGVGVGVVSTCVPLYQSEISPAKERGKFVTLNHVGFIAGTAAGLWVGYATSSSSSWHSSDWSWRVSLLLQLVPAAVFLAGLPFLPETPRWLLQKGHCHRATQILAALQQDGDDDDDDDDALLLLQEQSHRSLLEPSLLARLWRAFLLQFMAQMCGATAIKYYLPTLLRALGLEYRVALMAGAIEMTAKIGLTVVEMWLIDNFGRRPCLIGGSALMGVAMLINGLLPILSSSRASDGVCIAFIFVYAMGYSLGLGPAAWVYSAEIFPTSVRARGLNLAAAGGSIGSVLASQIWPIGNARLGSRIYFFFMAVNFICVPLIWFLYPETKGRALEDMDALFSNSQPGNPAEQALPDQHNRHDQVPSRPTHEQN